ncbi:hypothetical protein EJ05DRAFT_478204 [Pseudovirgaria hyperparasitica]|uniref:Uncharacterized protein n=1 Tax=Pseudovirgaria hyperparasitica TaxID=470096 RepID=A0A6A6W2E2_9PEZI|nr:uncharacterized protein EJ05DRAFT_478204 [Pseudovirgaria hyperparasitica]KAF2756184.1 hypothetical protein EJ05DRAFT_478204 [Pseudovirgaria hyperparasitica]
MSLFLHSARPLRASFLARPPVNTSPKTWLSKFVSPFGTSSILAYERLHSSLQTQRLLNQNKIERWRPQCVALGSLCIRRAYAANHDNNSDTQKPHPPPSPPSKTPITKKLAALTSHEQIYNVPNILTFTRLLAAPACGYLILTSQPLPALCLFLYAGITDLLDGYIARKYSLSTVVGSVIDPMADKLLMTIVVTTLAMNGGMPAALAVCILGRDVSLAVAALYYRGASLPAPKTIARYWDFSLPSAQVHPTTLSKYNTFLQLLLIGWHMVLPLMPAPPALLAPLLGSLAGVLQGVGMAGGGAGSWDAFTRVFQVGVAGTTLWSGMSYAFLKDAVTILGTDERLKERQGRRGRAIIGVTYAGFIAVAGWLVLNAEGNGEREEDHKEGAGEI